MLGGSKKAKPELKSLQLAAAAAKRVGSSDVYILKLILITCL
jgi:hypothetical protein